MISKISPFSMNNGAFKAVTSPKQADKRKSQNVVLIIPDGLGKGPEDPENPLSQYNPIFTQKDKLTYYFDLLKNNPSTQLGAHGKHVGLTDETLEAVGVPNDQMGNSEVGHLTIGSGRIQLQDLAVISKAIRDNEPKFYNNEALLNAINHAKANNSALHIMGLVSSGGVHSSLYHLKGLINLAAMNGMDPKKVYVHAFLDGRDTDPKSAIGFVQDINQALKDKKMPSIVSVAGRFFAMDRDAMWNRVEKAYDSLLLGKSYKLKDSGALAGEDLKKFRRDPKNLLEIETDKDKTFDTAEKAIQAAYDRSYTDEDMPPVMIGDAEAIKEHTIKDNDATIFFNFRTDRTKELTEAMTNPKYEVDDSEEEQTLRKNNKGTKRFNRSKTLDMSQHKFVCMTEYDERFKNFPNVEIAFPIEPLTNTLGEVVKNAGKSQARIAESEKKTHVGSSTEKSSFFDGQRVLKEKDYPTDLLKRYTFASPDVSSYAQAPKMSAAQVADQAIKCINDKINLVVLNFANPDMVGHEGDMKAAEEAVVETNDQIKRVVDIANANDYATLIVADHGNVERMYNPPVPGKKGSPHTAHTSNPVNCILVNYKDRGKDPDKFDIKLRGDRGLSDIAPTILQIMGIKKPKEMTGRTLIQRESKENTSQNTGNPAFRGKLDMVG